MKNLDNIVDQLLRKLSTTEAKSLLGVYILIAVIGFVWIKVEAARAHVSRSIALPGTSLH